MAKATARVELTIKQPIERVFSYLCDYSNNPSWQTGITHISQEGAMKMGQQIQIERTVLGRTVSSTVEVNLFEENHALRTKNVGGRFAYEGGYTLEPYEEGVRLVFEGCITTGRLMGPIGKLLAGRFQSQMEGDLHRLKRLLETS